MFSTFAFADDDYRSAMVRAVAAKEKAIDSNQPEDWAAALNQLRIADSIRVTAETKYEIGVAASRLDQEDIAVEAYSIALELGLSGSARDKARVYVSSHSSGLALLRVEGPDNTRVFVRGVERARLPLARFIFVQPGTIAFEAITESNEHITRILTLSAGQSESVSLNAGQSREESKPPADTQPAIHLPVSGTASGPFTPERESSGVVSFQYKPAPETPYGSSYPERQMGWLLLSAGSTLSALSIAFVAISSHKVNGSRQALLDNCAVQVNGPDSCSHAKPGHLDDAQADSDSIATWESARTASWVGLGAGLSAVIAGTTLLSLPKPRATGSAAIPHLSIEPHAFQLSFEGAL